MAVMLCQMPLASWPRFHRQRLLSIEWLERRQTPALVFTVSFDDSGSAYASYYSDIRTTALAAGADWSRYFPTANASIDLVIRFAKLDNAIATGSSETTVHFDNIGKIDVREQSAAYEARTGKDPNGSQPNGMITLDTDFLPQFWFDPTPLNREDDSVPFVTIGADGTAFFTGRRKESFHRLRGLGSERQPGNFDNIVAVEHESGVHGRSRGLRHRRSRRQATRGIGILQHATPLHSRGGRAQRCPAQMALTSAELKRPAETSAFPN
jgi:hypothetical protein